jgi:HK97 family phage major capsid protein
MEQLHKLIELVEKNMDENKNNSAKIEKRIADLESGIGAAPSVDEFKEAQVALKKQGETIALVEERLRNLDAALPVGDKIYQSIVPDKTEKSKKVRDDIARMILDTAAIINHSKPRFSDFFRAQVEGTAADGGYVMPTEYRAEIIRIVEQYGIARRLCRVIPMNHKDWTIPTNSDLPAVYWDTELVGVELNAPSESKVTFAKPTMTAHKLIAIDTLSIEVDEDSIPSIRDFVIDVFGIAIAKEEDYQMLTSPGTGTEPFTGLMALSGITEVTGAANTYAGTLQATGATGGYNKLIETMDAVDEAVSETAVWIGSNSVLNGIRQVKDLNEQPLYGQMAAGPPNSLFGRPYVRSRVMPKVKDGGSQASTAFLLYGDPSYHILGDRMSLTVDVSPHAAFKEAGIVLRVMERLGYCTTLKTPFARLKTSS